MKIIIVLLAVLLMAIFLAAAEVEMKEYPGMTLVIMEFQGSFDQMEGAFEKMMQEAGRQNNPAFVEPEELQTEIIIPVNK